MIPLSIPNFEGNEKKYVNEALAQGWVSTGGAYIDRLETELAEYLNVSRVAACQSGTAAIHLSLIQCKVEPGDMVIVPALTFIAAVNPVRYQFAEPIFIDCDSSLCMSPEKLLEFCKKECYRENDKLIHSATGKHIKALIVVHVFGNMADMEAIMKIARDYHLYVIEDATEALGTYYTSGFYKGKYAGTIGDFGTYSFNGNKIITTGGGGAVTAKSEEAVLHMKYLSTQAKDDELFYIHHEVGYNYRMTNLQAALGVAQLEQLDEFIRRKNVNYNRYQECFKDCKNVRLMEFRQGIQSNKWFYSLLICTEECGISIPQMIKELQGKGVMTRAIWGLMTDQRPYQEAIRGEIKDAYLYANMVLNIPCSTQLTEPEIRAVTESICGVLKETGV